MNRIDLIYDRFIHQTDTYTTQRLMERRDKRDEQGRPVKEWQFRRAFAGRCDHTPKCPPRTCPDITPLRLTERDIQAHLAGRKTLGVYQLKDNTVKWVCFDIDISKGTEIRKSTWENIRRQTRYLGKRLYELGVPFLVEFSGNRGMHVWVFFSEPVKSSDAYVFGHFCLEGVPVHPELHIEMFPKQPSTPNLGNVVKLPLGIHNKSGKWTEFVNARFEPYEDQWRALYRVRTMTPDDLDAFLTENNVDRDVLKGFKVRDADSGRGLPCYTNIMTKGVSEGSRDALTFYLSVFLKNHGMSPDLVQATVEAWNEKNDPPLDEWTLNEKIDSAFKRDYSHFACLKPEMEPFCDPNCKFYKNRMKHLKKNR